MPLYCNCAFVFCCCCLQLWIGTAFPISQMLVVNSRSWIVWNGVSKHGKTEGSMMSTLRCTNCKAFSYSHYLQHILFGPGRVKNQHKKTTVFSCSQGVSRRELRWETFIKTRIDFSIECQFYWYSAMNRNPNLAAYAREKWIVLHGDSTKKPY